MTPVTDPPPYLLRLYVAGATPRSLVAYANLRRLCEAHLPGQYELELVDVSADPAVARTEDIVALPTLVRRRPPPARRIIGDLNDTERVLSGLELDQGGESDVDR